MPRCLEIKHTLDGATHSFACDLVRLESGVGILRHVIDRTYVVGGTTLQPGEVTWALFWEDRPYTLYVWRLRSGPVFYFNIADSVLLQPGRFSWRDLAVDILISTTGQAQVLDEHELPPDLPYELAQHVRDATAHVLANFHAIIEEAESLLSAEP